MSEHHHHEGDTRSFTLTAFLSFAAVFSFLLLMAQCHGQYSVENKKLNNAEHKTATQSTEKEEATHH